VGHDTKEIPNEKINKINNILLTTIRLAHKRDRMWRIQTKYGGKEGPDPPNPPPSNPG
jgi:hypothetical protein